MDEVEIKVLGIDTDEVRNKLISLGGVLLKKEMQENYMYNLPENIENKNGYIRIRRVRSLIDGSNKVFLCSKKIISQDTFRKTEEHEFEVSDFDSCRAFIDSLGIFFHKQRNKYRESYLLNDTLVEIDIWDKSEFPEPYIEVEAVSQNKIFETLTLLDIPYEKATSKGLEQIKAEMGIY